MQNEAERRRMDQDHEHEKALEAKKMADKENLETSLFKARARQQYILQRIANGTATDEEMIEAGMSQADIQKMRDDLQKFGKPDSTPKSQGLSGEIGQVLTNQTQILSTICEAIKSNLTSTNSPIGEAVKAI